MDMRLLYKPFRILGLVLVIHQPVGAAEKPRCQNLFHPFTETSGISSGGAADGANTSADASSAFIGWRESFRQMEEVAIRRGVTPNRRPFALFHPLHPGRPAFLMIHGLGESADGMRPLAQRLFDLGHDVLAITLDGHGSTQERLHEVSIETWKDDISLGLQTLELRKNNIYLAGYSIGGGLAFQALREYPALVRGALLLSPLLSNGMLERLGRGRLQSTTVEWMNEGLPNQSNSYAYEMLSVHGARLAARVGNENAAVLWDETRFPRQPFVIVGAIRDMSVDMRAALQFLERSLRLRGLVQPDADSSAQLALHSVITPDNSHVGSIRPQDWGPMLDLARRLVDTGSTFRQ